MKSITHTFALAAAKVVGIYNRHDYYEERKAALQAWAELLSQLEAGETEKVAPIRRKTS